VIPKGEVSNFILEDYEALVTLISSQNLQL